MLKKLLLLAAVVLCLFSCVSSPKEATQTAPAWILSPPAPDSNSTFFVGQASDASGDNVKALEAATASLIAEIMRYIGVSITSETEATAKASLDSYKTDLVQTVKSTATNKIAGLIIQDKYTVVQGNRITLYILCRYNTKDLEREKKRIEDVFKAKVDAVARPEAEGKAFMQEGRPFDAVRKFAEAALAASTSDIENSSINFERNINNAKNALVKIRFIKGTYPSEGMLSKDFTVPFSARIVYGEGDSGSGIPGANIAVTYAKKQSSGRVIQKTENVLSDENGKISFLMSAPDSVGKQKLVFKLDFQDSLKPLRDVPAKYESLKSAFVEAVNTKFIEYEFTISSLAKNVNTFVAILDTDENGAVVSGNNAQSGVLEAMTKEKFKVKSIALTQAVLLSMDDDAIANEVKGKITGQDRLVYGVSKIDSVRKDGSNYIATASASVKVISVVTGELLYSKSVSTIAVDSSDAAARKAAYKDLGLNSLGKDIISNLP